MTIVSNDSGDVNIMSNDSGDVIIVSIDTGEEYCEYIWRCLGWTNKKGAWDPIDPVVH